MTIICRLIQSPPDNIGQFVDEILPEYGRLFGALAARQYQVHAKEQLTATIVHPEIRALAVMNRTNALAMMFVRRTESRCTVSFFHVLGGKAESEVGQTLLKHALATVLCPECPRIFTDYIPFCELQVEETFKSFDFHRVDRQIMVNSRQPGPFATPPGYIYRTATPEEFPCLAQVLFQTYVGHAESVLFEEVQSANAAQHFLHQCATSAYGACPHEFIIGAWQGPRCVGVAVGSEVVAGLGFVLHMAVLSSCQGNGVGSGLLNGLVTRFWEHGLTRAGLGVTCANPATRLYARYGFETQRVFPVYYHNEARGA